MSLLSKAIGFVARRLGFKPGPDVTPLGPAHVYPAPLSREEFWWGPYQCTRCPYFDKQRARFTNPPCSRRNAPVPREDPDA